MTAAINFLTTIRTRLLSTIPVILRGEIITIMKRRRIVLLVSDQCWQDILSLVPIAIRPERKLPVLIYHQEGDIIDVDATLHFLRKYLPSKDGEPDDVAIIHVGALSPKVNETLGKLLIEVIKECNITTETPPIGQVNHIWTLQSLYTDIKTWVVVGRDDYESGLIAAPFAAQKGAHLLFLDADTLEAYKKEYKEAYKSLMSNLKTVYLVGQLDEKVRTFFLDNRKPLQINQMTSRDIQREYLKDLRDLQEVECNKIILVNPHDLNLYYYEPNDALLKEAPGEICRLYGGCSLVAPFLAADKQEIIIPISNPYPKKIDDLLSKAIARLELEPKFLTIVASPEAIPMSALNVYHMVELDGRVYGSKEKNFGDMNLATGRIFGITVSDCSAYVARVLFFEELDRPEPQVLSVSLEAWSLEEGCTRERLYTSDKLEEYLENHCWTEEVREPFGNAWCSVYGQPPHEGDDDAILTDDQKEEVESCYRKASLILYTGHATYDGFADPMRTSNYLAQKNEAAYLDGFPVILGIGCSTGAYEMAKFKKTQLAKISDENQEGPTYFFLPEPKLAYLFVAQNIRRGAMAQQCAVGVAYWHNELNKLLTELYVNEPSISIGEAILKAKNWERCTFKADKFDNFTRRRFDGDPHYLLVGDPTFVPQNT